MIDLRPRTLLRHRLRCIFIAPLAIVFVVASLGVTWTVGPQKDRSVAFPCMDRACGCHDAASCKQHCCCFSDAEKLAWAAERHVDPAPFVSRSEGIARVASEPGSCCASQHDCTSPASSREVVRGESQPGRVGLRCVSVAAERHCRGLAQLWSVLAAALPATSVSCFEFDWVCGDLVVEFTPAPTGQRFSPPTPPPRG